MIRKINTPVPKKKQFPFNAADSVQFGPCLFFINTVDIKQCFSHLPLGFLKFNVQNIQQHGKEAHYIHIRGSHSHYGRGSVYFCCRYCWFTYVCVMVACWLQDPLLVLSVLCSIQLWKYTNIRYQ